MQNVADTLTSKYTWNKFTFDATPGTPLWRFRYLISCIIVGGNNEADTLRCDKELFTRYPTVEALAAAKFRDLADLLEKYDLQYAGNKAKHIIDTSSKIAVLGDVPDNRDALECLPGVVVTLLLSFWLLVSAKTSLLWIFTSVALLSGLASLTRMLLIARLKKQCAQLYNQINTDISVGRSSTSDKRSVASAPNADHVR